MLDELYGLAVQNQDAIDLLQMQIRSYVFKDTDNFRTQLDEWELLMNQLINLGVGFSDADKKNLLFLALRNRGIIGRLFEHDIGMMKSRVMSRVAGGALPDFDDCMTLINIRYADLSAEASTIVPPKRGGMEHKRDQKKARVHFAGDEQSDEKSDTEAALMVAPNKGGKGNVTCSKCGRKGHEAKDCWGDKPKCEVCGKGHPTESCWKNQTCSICGMKGHVARICRQQKKNGGGGGNAKAAPGKKAGGIADQAMEHLRKSSK
jgi:hypothetical protein